MQILDDNERKPALTSSHFTFGKRMKCTIDDIHKLELSTELSYPIKIRKSMQCYQALSNKILVNISDCNIHQQL